MNLFPSIMSDLYNAVANTTEIVKTAQIACDDDETQAKLEFVKSQLLAALGDVQKVQQKAYREEAEK